MFLEQNRIQGVIVSRTPRNHDELRAWRKLAESHRILFLVDDFGGAPPPLYEFADVLAVNSKLYPQVAANIKAALEAMDLQPYEAIYVTEEDGDVEDAIRTRVGVVKIGSDIGDHLPDMYVDDAEQVVTVLMDRRARSVHGYGAEVQATRGNRGLRPESTGWIIFSDGFLATRPHLDRATAERTRLIILGRYFAKQDHRHRKHQPSQRILAAKGGRPNSKVLAAPLESSLILAYDRMGIDIMTRVPPKPWSDKDHLVPIINDALKAARREGRDDIANSFKPAAIHCTRHYTPQKEVGDYRLRARNVKDAFEADRSIVAGKSVLLIDDILTSGSTVIEAARALYEAGATNVTVLVFGMDQKVIALNPDEAVPCPSPNCTGKMAIRYNSRDDGAFWGCDQFYVSGCRATMQWGTGLSAANRLISRDNIAIWNNVDF